MICGVTLSLGALYLIILCLLLLHSGSGAGVHGLEREAFVKADHSNGMVETETGRDLLDLLSLNAMDQEQVRRKREDPGTADSPNNEITIDLSNPDYLRDYHHRIRRVKKVLPSDNKFSAEERLGKVNPENKDINPVRPKRYVALREAFLRLPVPYLSIGEAAASTILIANSAEEQYQVSTNPPSSETTTPSTKTNITGLEFKLFQNTLVAALVSFCPKLKAEYSILLDSVQHSVKNEIRAAYSLLPRKPSKNSKLFLLMKRISKCSLGVTHKLQEHQKARSSTKHNASPEVRPKLSRVEMIRQYFANEGKRLALMSQKDVIPSIPNIIKFYNIILEKVTKNCLELETESDLVSESQRTGDLLLAIIELQKESQLGKKATIHQLEMEKLIDLSKLCGSDDHLAASKL